MKQSARKKSALSLVRPLPEPAEPPAEVTSGKLKEFFTGWLDAVQPINQAEQSAKKETRGSRDLASPLTLSDIVRVNHATIRESHTHRVWPLEAIEKFMVADVIKRK